MSQKNQHQVWEELKKKIEFLKKPEGYFERTSKVEAIETHMSWVFLTDHYAYKLKKPVAFPFMNLTELHSRYANCLKELKINQELAPGIYRDVLPLMQGRSGDLIPLGSNNNEEVVDYLLKMKRIPLELTLEQYILHNYSNKISTVEEAAKILTRFYQNASTVKLRPDTYKTRQKKYIDDNFEVLISSHYGLNSSLIKSLHQLQLSELDYLWEEISQRISLGKFKDCHGDLRPQHICLSSPPVIIDRLDFNDELRMMDPCDELSYLSLECELLGRPDIGALFFTIYQKETNDCPTNRLLSFYKSYRAGLRARMCIWHLDDPRIEDLDKWFRKAECYLKLSASFLQG